MVFALPASQTSGMAFFPILSEAAFEFAILLRAESKNAAFQSSTPTRECIFSKWTIGKKNRTKLIEIIAHLYLRQEVTRNE